MTLGNVPCPSFRTWPGTILRSVAACLLAAAWFGCATGEDPSRLVRFEYARPEMGVPFRIVFYARDRPSADSAAKAAFSRIAALNDHLSDYEYDSELSALSRTSGSNTNVPVSPELWKVLVQAQQLSGETQGAFDVTAGPMTSLWRKARRDQRLPAPDRLETARRQVGHRFLLLDSASHSVRLERPSMRLDLGGIAKGYAADEALAELRRHGIDRALVAAAGDIALGAPPPGRRGWTVSVGDIDAPGAPAAQGLEVAHCGVSTSGDLFQFVEIDGVRYSHIVDPRTGVGLTNQCLVTVVAPNGITADSLATAISVLGPESGPDLASTHHGVAAHVVFPQDGRFQVRTTPRFDRLPRDRAPATIRSETQ
jgi:FAD:protein FMN transferase